MITCSYFHVPFTYMSSLLSESLEQAKFQFTVIYSIIYSIIINIYYIDMSVLL